MIGELIFSLIAKKKIVSNLDTFRFPYLIILNGPWKENEVPGFVVLKPNLKKPIKS